MSPFGSGLWSTWPHVGDVSVTPDGRLLLAPGGVPRLFRVASAKELPLAFPSPDLRFTDAETLAGPGPDGTPTFWRAETGEPLRTWTKPGAILPVLTSSARGVALAIPRTQDEAYAGKNHPIEILKLETGELLEKLPLSGGSDSALSPDGTLRIVDEGRLHFFRLPGAISLGTLLAHPDASRTAFLTKAGPFEVSGAIDGWSDVLRCGVGPAELPFSVCADALQRTGLAGTVLRGAE